MLQSFKEQLFYRTPLVAASELESNTNNANLDKNKEAIFIF